MPQQKVVKTLTYSDAEIKALVIKDMIDKGTYKNDRDKVTYMKELKRQEGSIPLGQFDEDPYYVFGGIEMTIEVGI